MKEILIYKLPIYLLITGLVAMIMVATHPLGFNNYGYDYGFYSYAVQHTALDSPAYFAGQVNDYGNHLFVLLNTLRLPQIPSLNFLFISFFVISAILFYETLKKFGNVTALVGIFLFIFSITQSQLYTMYLWKAAYGELLMLLIFLLIQQNKYFWEFIPLAVLFITHKTSSIIALGALMPNYIFGHTKKKPIVLGAIILCGLIFLFGLNGFHYMNQLLHSDVRDGLFMEPALYLKYTWYLIPLAGYGAYLSIKTKSNLQWLGLLGVSLVFVILELAFFQRVLLYLDLSLIFFSAQAVGKLSKNNHLQPLIAGLVIILAGLNFALFTNNNIQPLISDAEITEIQNFSKTHQGGFILSLSAQDGPWLLANLGGNNRLAAPGMFEDKYSKELWQKFWETPSDQNFLEAYPKPLYLYERATIFFREPWDCLTKVSAHFYEYTCSK